MFRLVLRCLLLARKENLTGVSTGLTGRSKNLVPTGNPTDRSTRPVSISVLVTLLRSWIRRFTMIISAWWLQISSKINKFTLEVKLQSESLECGQLLSGWGRFVQNKSAPLASSRVEDKRGSMWLGNRILSHGSLTWKKKVLAYLLPTIFVTLNSICTKICMSKIKNRWQQKGIMPIGDDWDLEQIPSNFRQ